MPDNTVTGTQSSRIQQPIGSRRSKRKRPSQILKGKRVSSGEDLERTPGQELILDVLGPIHEGTQGMKSPSSAPLRGAVSGYLVGAKIGEAVQKYQRRKAKRKLGEDSV